MGIPGLWEEVERVLTLQDTTLAAESAACVEAKGRPLRIAVDASVVIYKLRESTRPAAKYGEHVYMIAQAAANTDEAA